MYRESAKLCPVSGTCVSHFSFFSPTTTTDPNPPPDASKARQNGHRSGRRIKTHPGQLNTLPAAYPDAAYLSTDGAHVPHLNQVRHLSQNGSAADAVCIKHAILAPKQGQTAAPFLSSTTTTPHIGQHSSRHITSKNASQSVAISSKQTPDDQKLIDSGRHDDISKLGVYSLTHAFDPFDASNTSRSTNRPLSWGSSPLPSSDIPSDIVSSADADFDGYSSSDELDTEPGFQASDTHPKHDLLDKNGARYTVDALIKNKDNDSWKGNTGTGDSKVVVSFGPGEDPILCRRSRLSCKVERRELDPTSRDAVFAAQPQTRREEGTTPERKVTEFLQLIRTQKCNAVDKHGRKCAGAPILRARREVSRGHNFWVSCSGYGPGSTTGHRSWRISDNVDEPLFVRAFSGAPMVEDEIEAKIVTDKLWQVPLSTVPAMHPEQSMSPSIPVFASFELKESYRQCIKAAGTVGATVAKVDNASSTQVLLGGKTPAEHAAPLQSKRLKKQLVLEAKKEQYPAGLDAAGAFKLFWDDMKKPIDERYIQCLVTMPDGRLMILTCLSALMKLLHDTGVTSFETDTTFKRVAGDINEWEVVLFLKSLQRAVTIARAYINGASTDFYERLYDEFQSIKLETTGKPVAFKRFVPNGNIIAMNSDMEGAQVLGAARSFFKLNNPAYSALSNDTPAQQVAPEIIKLGETHAKRGARFIRTWITAH
ncbi:hypothetical protein DFH09DRAFT_1472832 [Mycena vulgaris]|nr:hypothetical protein DFH09DRAFT_1472832 [Mycena vulgaris]